MNKKGFATIGIMMVVLFVSMILMGTFFNPILNTTVNIENSKDLTPNYIKNMNSMERLYSIFRENPSHVGTITFEDLDKSYEITEISEEHSINKQTIRSSGRFEINNKTYLNVEFKVDSREPGKIGEYDIEIKLNGETITSDMGLVNNTLIEIGEDFFYNETNGESNFGEVEIIINQDRLEVSADVEYRNLDRREVEITTDGSVRTLIIEKDDNPSIYFE